MEGFGPMSFVNDGRTTLRAHGERKRGRGGALPRPTRGADREEAERVRAAARGGGAHLLKHATRISNGVPSRSSTFALTSLEPAMSLRPMAFERSIAPFAVSLPEEVAMAARVRSLLC